MLELEKDNLSEIVSENSKVLVMFGASWCGMCKMTKPKVKRKAGESEHTFVYVDAEHMVESRNFVGAVSNLPSFAAIVDGEVVFCQEGPKSFDTALNHLG